VERIMTEEEWFAFPAVEAMLEAVPAIRSGRK
jgi:hypothetical protein